MKKEIRIDFGNTHKTLWTNALKEKCVSFTDGDETIKILNIPETVAESLSDWADDDSSS